MKPVAYTFVDDRMLPYAEEQAENFSKFGLEHRIIRTPKIESYDTNLWIRFMDLTIDAINEDKKIFRVDAEIRIHKPLPQSWLDEENVLFHFYPIVKHPWYIPINTGHMILSKSSLQFCELLKECMLALIPPDNDTLMPSAGEGHHIDDETPAAIAIRLSKMKYLAERLKQDRRYPMQCAINRGLWIEESTILTHPWIHNWNVVGGGPSVSLDTYSVEAFLNHYVGDLRIGEMISKLMLEKSKSSIWKKIASALDDDLYESHGWIFSPSDGTLAPKEHWNSHRRRLV